MKKTEYTIRNARPEDIEALTRLLQTLFAVEPDFVFNEIKQRRGLLLMLEASEKRRIMVAESGGRVIGMCSAQLLISTAEGGTAALIEDLVVSEEYRGQGIGRNLLLSVEDWALRQGATRLELLADRNNTPALEFYQKIAWRQTRLICLHKKPN